MSRRVVVLPTAEQISDAHYILVDSIEDGTQKYSLGRLNREIADVDQELNGSSAKAIANKAVKNALDTKAPLASPAFSGAPTAPTAPAGTNTDQLATTAFVKAAIDGSGGGYTLPPATTSALGGVKPDGTTITADADGTIHGADATPIATTGAVGKVKPDGTTITVDQDGTIHGRSTYQLPIASASTLGGVKPDGTTITIDQNGTISATASGSSEYVLPPATTSQLGGVKPDGTSITVDQDGTIHGQSVGVATNERLGLVKPDVGTITIDADGTIHGPNKTSDLYNDRGFITRESVATESLAGTVKPDGTTITVDGNGVISSTGGSGASKATDSTLGIVMPDNETLIVDDDGVLSAAAPSFYRGGDYTDVPMEDSVYAVFAVSQYAQAFYVKISSSSPYLTQRFYYNKTVLSSSRVVVFTDGTVLMTYESNIDSNGIVKNAILGDAEWKLSGVSDLSDYSIRVELENISGNTIRTLTGYAVRKRMVVGRPIIPDGASIAFDHAGRLASSLGFESPLRRHFDSSTGKISVGLQLNSSIGIYDGYLGIVPADAARAIFQDETARDYALTGISENNFGDGLSYEDGKVSIRQASASAVGMVKPDNETVFVDENGVLSFNVSEAFEQYERTIASLQRRVAEIEKLLGIDAMTYEDGTLYADSTYENGTLVTNREYSDGTLI